MTAQLSPERLDRCRSCGTIDRLASHVCDPAQVERHRAQIVVLGAYFNKGRR